MKILIKQYTAPLSFLLFLTFSIFPFIPLLSYRIYDHQRLVQVGFVCISCLLFLYSMIFSKCPPSFRFLKNDVLLISILLSFGFLSAVLSRQPIDSFMYWVHCLFLFMLLAMATNLYRADQLKIILVSLVAIHSCVVLLSLLNLIFALAEGNPLLADDIYYGFENIRFFNQVQVFVLPLLLLSLGIVKVKNIILFLLFVNLLLIFIGSARGAMIAWLSILVAIFFINKSLRSLVWHGVIITAVSGVMFFIIRACLGDGSGLIIKTHTSGRAEMWLATIENLQFSHLLFGDGPGIFAYRVNSTVFSHPHNSGIEIINEWGLIAFLLFLYLVVSTLGRGVRYMVKHPEDTLTITVLYSWLSGVAYSLFSGVIVMPIPQTLLFIFWGVLLGRVYQRDVCAMMPNLALSKQLLAPIIAAVLVIYLCMTYISYSKLNYLEPSFQGPRFWASGERNLVDWSEVEKELFDKVLPY